MGEISKKDRRGGPRPGFGGRQKGAGRPRKHRTEPIPEITEWEGPRWCVFQTFPHAERLAIHELARSGYRAYMPMIMVRRRDPLIHAQFNKVLVPRLSGYGFVELHSVDPWAPIIHLPGVRSMLLTTNRRPSPVPVGGVERLQADDKVMCELADEILPRLPVNTICRIKEGAFSEAVGVVVADDGFTTSVMLDVFGRHVVAKTRRASLEKVA